MLLGLVARTEGFVVRDGVRVHYQVFGNGVRAILLLPTWSVVHSDGDDTERGRRLRCGRGVASDLMVAERLAERECGADCPAAVTTLLEQRYLAHAGRDRELDLHVDRGLAHR